ncbi:MAG TPA: TatD family hydrolase [Alphaproteobacteria bacterium]|nr:TatD family hydrolase [Alphaproteobacteria bacterium]
MAADNNDNNQPKKTGFMAGFSKAVREISAEIKKDLNNAPPPKAGEGSGYKTPDHLVKAVSAAQSGLAFVETPAEPGATIPQAPLQPHNFNVKPLNPWQALRESGSQKKFATDAYYHAYTPADLAHYVRQLPQGVPTVSLLCAEAGDELLLEGFQATLRAVPSLFGATGFSPRNLQPDADTLDTTLTELLNNNPKILAVGPVGLDLTYTSHNLAQQAEQMTRQLEIAADFGLPALVFQNGALTELRDILEQGISLPQKLVWLKPIQTEAELEFIQEYNFYVAFRAEITWPKETFYREAVRQILPHRWLAGSGNSLKSTHNRAGHFNSAAGMNEIIDTLAELLKVDVNALKERLNMNFAAVYGPAAA